MVCLGGILWYGMVWYGMGPRPYNFIGEMLIVHSPMQTPGPAPLGLSLHKACPLE
jgi:hypothetical protein